MSKNKEQEEEKKKARRNRKRLCIGIICSLVIGFAIGLNWDKIEPKVKECSSKAVSKGKEILEEKKIATKVDDLKDYADKLLTLSGKYADKAKDIAKQIKDM
ncbi:MAG: hypothetical protein K6G87_11640 [Butyrivibrio sp.]|uniref:hypothetical protein n=1 Tax=Butyrivibrio sp. TaxID=28121 RepID=UPI0025D73461|nr:hypothetical protein [Butyrivibrio sp.]MCR5771865.1 hypothetical protein [Butyrivibrio sp.]